jgi:hypothetical protein
MSTLHVPVTGLNQVLTLSVLTLLVPCLASKTALMQRYFCWVLGCTQPSGRRSGAAAGGVDQGVPGGGAPRG